jgi:hypothetical protein
MHGRRVALIFPPITLKSGSFVAGCQQQSLGEFSLTVSSNEAQQILI